jgi:uracil-DNA glycosylase
VPNFLPEDPAATTRLLLLGLAPAAHGANRTGRMFTGDRSGDFLFAAMHAAGLCNQPTGTHLGDGLELRGCAITAAAHCAPPGNKPTPEELSNCSSHLADTFDAMPELRAVVTLGKIAHDALLRLCKARGGLAALKDAPFAHGHRYQIGLAFAGRPTLLAIHCTYHPSQQNTFTGRLTHAMLETVLTAARRDADSRPPAYCE